MRVRKKGKKKGVAWRQHPDASQPLTAAMCVFVEGVHAFVEPKDLSSVCCWLWQPAVRGAQGEREGQVNRRASGRRGLEPALAHSK